MSSLRLRRSASSTLPMSRIRLLHSSTTPISRLCLLFLRRSSSSSTTSTSPPSRSWCLRAAFSAATQRVRAGTLSPEDARNLFDELLRQTIPVQERSLNSFLAALARAPSYDDRRSGPALAVTLFNRMRWEEAGPRVAHPTVCTYNIIMDCCCRAHRPDLGLALFGHLFKMGLRLDQIAANTLLKCLCYAKQTDEAVSVLLHRMSELGCLPDVISYNTVLKRLCEDSRSQEALDLLHAMAKEGDACSPNVVSYNTVIHGFFREGEVSRACNLLHEMMQLGVLPDVSTYTSIVDALC